MPLYLLYCLLLTQASGKLTKTLDDSIAANILKVLSSKLVIYLTKQFRHSCTMRKFRSIAVYTSIYLTID